MTDSINKEQANEVAKPSQKSNSYKIFSYLEEEKGLKLLKSPTCNAVRVNTGEGTRLFDPNTYIFKQFIRATVFKDKGQILRTAEIDEIAAHIDSLCTYYGSLVKIYNRIALYDNKIYIALDQDRFAEINQVGYKTISECPAHILMSPLVLPLPVPEQEPRYNFPELSNIFNLTEEESALIAAFCLAAFVPPELMAYPILSISGEQGAAKSTLTRFVKSVIGPSRAMARNFPKKEQDLAITAQGESVLAYDNLSTLSPQMSDALCRLSTGGEFTTRKLYTDNEEIILNAKVPVILNGIPDLANRGDLADRTYAIRMRRIPESERLPEKEVNKIFESIIPHLLGNLFRSLSHALAHAEQLRVENLPRMADAAKWAITSEKLLGFEEGTMLRAFERNTAELLTQVAHADEFAIGIIDFIKEKEEWYGTTTNLLNDLRQFYNPENPRWLPKTPVSLGNRLRRVITALHENGIQFSENRTGRERTIKINLLTAEIQGIEIIDNW